MLLYYYLQQIKLQQYTHKHPIRGTRTPVPDQTRRSSTQQPNATHPMSGQNGNHIAHKITITMCTLYRYTWHLFNHNGGVYYNIAAPGAGGGGGSGTPVAIGGGFQGAQGGQYGGAGKAFSHLY